MAAPLKSKGIKIHYTTDVTDPYSTYVQLGCIQSVKDFQGIQAEMGEHYCLDDTMTIKEKYPTGFITLPDATITVGGATIGAKYKAMYDFCAAGTKLTWKIEWPLDVGQTTSGLIEVTQAYITKVGPMIADDGGEMKFELTLCKTLLPTVTAGA